MSAIERVDAEGYNAIDFAEFVFVAANENESFVGRDFVAEMTRYYYFQPRPLHRVNAWKNLGVDVDLIESGGHTATFKGRRIYPEQFVLRHYISLSHHHTIAKYQSRVFSQAEISERAWHGWRSRFKSAMVRLPDADVLKTIDPQGNWDRSDPRTAHLFIVE